MIRAFWEKLNARQQKWVAGTAMLVVMVLILEIFIFPFRDARAKLTKSIQTNQRKLNEVIKLDAEFAAQEAAIERVKRGVSARGAGFSLFSYLEKKAEQANVRGRIKQMNSSRGTSSASFEESLIDLKLEKITLKQLTDFLFYVESPADLIRVKKMTISKMKDNPDYLSAQMQISSFQPLNQP